MNRGDAWKHFGAPTDQVGSVNDPRTHDDHGVKWNEKWVYRDDDESVCQVVLFLRYDLVGAFRVKRDGTTSPLPIPE